MLKLSRLERRSVQQFCSGCSVRLSRYSSTQGAKFIYPCTALLRVLSSSIQVQFFSGCSVRLSSYSSAQCSRFVYSGTVLLCVLIPSIQVQFYSGIIWFLIVIISFLSIMLVIVTIPE